jgi:hypothetical protein
MDVADGSIQSQLTLLDLWFVSAIVYIGCSSLYLRFTCKHMVTIAVQLELSKVVGRKYVRHDGRVVSNNCGAFIIKYIAKAKFISPGISDSTSEAAHKRTKTPTTFLSQ